MLKTGKYSLSGLLIIAIMLSLSLPVLEVAQGAFRINKSTADCCSGENMDMDSCCGCGMPSEEESASNCDCGPDDFCHTGQVSGNSHLVLLLGYLPVDYSLSLQNDYSINSHKMVDVLIAGYTDLLERPPQTLSIA